MKAFAGFFLGMVLCGAAVAQSMSFDWATVGNPGNPGNVLFNGTYGAVGYEYRIAKTEVTNAQYVKFLNSVADDDPNGLFEERMGSTTEGGITRTGSPGSYLYTVKSTAFGQGPGGSNFEYANKPVNYVSYFDAMRFVNWLANGQPVGAQSSNTTEEGAYAISNGRDEIRAAGARFFIPNEDEWFKAAYHKNDGVTGNYWLYPTATNVVPVNNLPANDTGNAANFWNEGYATGDIAYPLTDAGDYSLSHSSYGTFDQGGSLWEWNEARIGSPFRGMRGGAWDNTSGFLHSSARTLGGMPQNEGKAIGFRIAALIPEPSSLLLAAMAIMGLLLRRQVKCFA